MSGISIKDGVRAPLFDRLSETPEVRGARSPSGVLDRAGQRESLQRELTRLLNTRSSYPSEAKGQAVRSVIDYGLPDYSAMHTHSPEDKKKLADLVRRTVEAFEPRLGQVNVEAELLGNSEKALLVQVTGVFANGRIRDRVSFALQVSGEDLTGSRIGS